MLLEKTELSLSKFLLLLAFRVLVIVFLTCESTAAPLPNPTQPVSGQVRTGLHVL